MAIRDGRRLISPPSVAFSEKMDVMPTIHFVLLGAFLLVTMLLLVTSSGGLNRAPDVELFWRDVRAHAIPPGPAIFVSLMVLLLVATLAFDLGIYPLVPAGYLLGGLVWLVASVLTAAVVITHHGVIVHGRDERHRVAWKQIVDYFKFDGERKKGYVLFYNDRTGRRRRVEVSVPPRHWDDFEHLLSRYLDGRLVKMPEETYGDSAT